ERALADAGLPGGPPRDEAGAGEAFVRDLHLFGRASLFRLVATPGTPSGRRRLADWLVLGEEAGGAEAEAASIRARQAAVRALAPELDWRAGLEAIAWGSPRRREGAPEDGPRPARREGAGRHGEPVLDR